MGTKSRFNVSAPHDMEAMAQALYEKLTEDITEKVMDKLTESFNAVFSEYGLPAIRQPKLDRPLEDKASHLYLS